MKLQQQRAEKQEKQEKEGQQEQDSDSSGSELDQGKHDPGSNLPFFGQRNSSMMMPYPFGMLPTTSFDFGIPNRQASIIANPQSRAPYFPGTLGQIISMNHPIKETGNQTMRKKSMRSQADGRQNQAAGSASEYSDNRSHLQNPLEKFASFNFYNQPMVNRPLSDMKLNHFQSRYDQSSLMNAGGSVTFNG